MMSQQRTISCRFAEQAAFFVGLVLACSLVAGCTAGREASTMSPDGSTQASTPTPPRDRMPTTETKPTPVPTPVVTPSVSPKKAEYEADIAAWTEPLPPGYSWPAWEDLPHLDPLALGPLGSADNAAGVYRCILIDVAWHAYFEANDPVGSKDYAIRSDQYLIPDNPSFSPVTERGNIIDSELARANAICTGISGPLKY